MYNIQHMLSAKDCGSYILYNPFLRRALLTIIQYVNHFFILLKRGVISPSLRGPQELDEVMREYIHFYNAERPHRKLNMKTPLQFETELFTYTCK